MTSYSDTYIRHQVRVENLKEGEANKIVRALRDAHAVLIALVRGSENVTAQRIALALQRYQDAIDAAYESIKGDLLEDGQEFVRRNIGFHSGTLKELTAATVVAPPARQVFTAALTEPFDGALFADWLRKNAATDVMRVSAALREAWVTGASNTEALNMVRPVLNQSENSLKTITRSYFGQMNQASREATFRANDDLVTGKIWISILDSRTTADICAPRDQKTYTLENEPKGHDLVWGSGPGSIHWNCRSTSVPELRGVDETYSRPAISAGDNYESGDNALKPTRANVKNDTYEIERTTTDYAGWFHRQPADFQRDALGAELYERYQNVETVSGSRRFFTNVGKAAQQTGGGGFKPVNPTPIELFGE